MTSTGTLAASGASTSTSYHDATLVQGAVAGREDAAQRTSFEGPHTLAASTTANGSRSHDAPAPAATDLDDRRFREVLNQTIEWHKQENDERTLHWCGPDKFCIRDARMVEWRLKRALYKDSEEKSRSAGEPTLEELLERFGFRRESSHDGLDCWVYKGRGRCGNAAAPRQQTEEEHAAPIPLVAAMPQPASPALLEECSQSHVEEVSGVPVTPPPPPPHRLQLAVLYVGIPGLPRIRLEVPAVRELLAFLQAPSTTRLVLLSGSEGMGKSYLASALVRNVRVRATYPDGLAWLSMDRPRRRRRICSGNDEEFMRHVLVPKYREMVVQFRLTHDLDLPYHLEATLFSASHDGTRHAAAPALLRSPMELYHAMSGVLLHKQFLVVLDGVDSLDYLRWFLFEGVPSLVTTRSECRHTRLPAYFFGGSGRITTTNLPLPRPSPEECVDYFLQASGRGATNEVPRDANDEAFRARRDSNHEALRARLHDPLVQHVVELCSRVPGAMEKASALVSVGRRDAMSMETFATRMSPQLEEYALETEYSPEAKLSACRRIAEAGTSDGLAVIYQGAAIWPPLPPQRPRGRGLLTKRPYDEFMRQQPPPA